ncbi:MAG: two-component system, OmpR family, sensor kinase [Gaiellales bacterium]|nr:two-component system, OmpR family, sensor kinase [Gaiellales bacterium]
MSLRTRLLIAVLGLLAIGFAGAGTVIYQLVQSSLIARVDNSFPLTASVGRRLRPPPRSSPPNTDIFSRAITTVLRARDGHVLVKRIDPRAPLPPDVIAARPTRHQLRSLTYQGHHVRVLLDRSSDGRSVVVAVPLDDVDSTLARLLRAELIVSTAVLAALAALGWWVLTVGLRPLDRIAGTADAIAGGDLTRRVPAGSARTEIGRVAVALNTMLVQIEAALAQSRASERRLRQFVADASHELRTPLTSIRGHAELFRRGAAERPADAATAMRRIEEQSTRMTRLVDDLLQLAHLDEEQPLQISEVDLSRLVTKAVGDARELGGLTITSVVDPGVMLDGDEVRLRQVVDNLLTNIRVHTPRGTRASVMLRVEDGEAVLEVSDTGPGIPPEHAGQVFERFYRADASRSRDAGGSGLGLAIVASTVHAHGGRVHVETAAGSGATFRAYLPCSATPIRRRSAPAGGGATR